MCQGGEAESVNGDLGNSLETEIKMMGENNNNNHFYNAQPYGNVQPFCSCMSGSRRVRKRHPATVQTPGRQFVEDEVMEPLVNYLDRLEPSWANTHRNNGANGRDLNDNFRCDGDKGYETQFVMEFSHLRLGSQRQPGGSFEESATTQDLKNCRLLSSKLK